MTHGHRLNYTTLTDATFDLPIACSTKHRLAVGVLYVSTGVAQEPILGGYDLTIRKRG